MFSQEMTAAQSSRPLAACTFWSISELATANKKSKVELPEQVKTGVFFQRMWLFT